MENGFFKYEVIFWDEIDNCERTTQGLLFADTYTNACNKLEETYSLIDITHLYALEPSEVFDFDLENADNHVFKVTATKEN